MEEKKKNWFVRHKILTGVLVVIVVLVFIGAVGGSGTGTNKNESASTGTDRVEQAKPMEVDASVLVADYDKNKIAAQDKYTGKVVQTTGFIKNISNDVTGNYYLSLNPNNEEYYFGTTIACYFADESAKSEITQLENGQSVTVQGKMADMSLGIVVMNDCKIVK